MTKKLWLTFKWIFLYGVGLYIVFSLFKFLLLKILPNEDSAKQALMLVTFIGGLFGGVLLEKLKNIFSSPEIEISTWEEDEDNIRVFENQNRDFRFRVKNKSKNSVARGCSVKITLEYEREDIIPSGNTYIMNKEQFAKIEDEHIMWDFQPNGTNVYRLDIPPQDSYLVTIVRYEKTRNFLEIPSENLEQPRVYINFNKQYVFTVAVYGENFEPVRKKIELKKISS